ncbi:MAG: glycosyltransferase family 2 protein [Flavobacteriaceae bacterium]
MGYQSPLVSIIIPTFNRVHLIGETLDSVLAQTYTNWECIVVDDGSSDGTEILVRDYQSKDSRIQYYKRPFHRPKGANACRNYGFELSQGAYINWLDSDDLISKHKLELQIKKIKEIKNSIAICRWQRFTLKPFDEFSNRDYSFFRDYYTPKDIFLDFGLNKSFLPHHVYLVSRAVIVKAKLWDESIIVNQDGEFFTRIILSSDFVGFINDTLAFIDDQLIIQLAIFQMRKQNNRFN